MTSPGRSSNVNKPKPGVDKTPLRGNMSQTIVPQDDSHYNPLPSIPQTHQKLGPNV